MAEHTTFKVGGPAELWIRPEGDGFPEYTALLLKSARDEEIPVFILGGGANIVVSDRGIRGIVLDTSGYGGATSMPCGGSIAAEHGPDTLWFRSGTAVDDAVNYAAAGGLSGLEFLAGMPGSVGGALWMNARCYNREMADVVNAVQFLEGGRMITTVPQKKEFAYKKSPFQGRDSLILAVSFSLQKKDTELIRNEIEDHRKDREAKGHYRFPSAGSVFKNNRVIGKPTGRIIDELGLRGLTIGDAQVAPWHGNIIINRGKARSSDILALVETIEERVMTVFGLELDREILFV